MKEENEIKTLEGSLVVVPFVNKGGREIAGAESLFFKTEEKRYFIKFSAGKVLRTDLEKYLGQIIKVKGFTTFGLWDTNDPRVQSRVGDYIGILEIL